LNAGRTGADHRLVAAAGATVPALFIALFRFQRLGPLDFWAWLALNAVIASAIAFALDGRLARRLGNDARSRPFHKTAMAIASAAVLYGVFALGRAVSLRLFPYAAVGLSNVYALGAGVSARRLILLIGLVIGPGEELFWRAFFQENVGSAVGRTTGFILTALLYASIHLASGNIMLVLAAAVSGAFWGWLYWRFRSPLLNVVSHTVWDLFVFVFMPFSSTPPGEGVAALELVLDFDLPPPA
jgi:hypothetical protein